MCKLYTIKQKTVLCPTCNRVHEPMLLEIPPDGSSPWDGEQKFEWFFCEETNSMFTKESLSRFQEKELEPACLPEELFHYNDETDEWVCETCSYCINIPFTENASSMDEQAYDNDSEIVETNDFTEEAVWFDNEEPDRRILATDDQNLLFSVSATRFRNGIPTERRFMKFENYDFATEWLRRNGFFIGENKFFTDITKQYEPGGWIRRFNYLYDFTVASIKSVESDFMMNGVLI